MKVKPRSINLVKPDFQRVALEEIPLSEIDLGFIDLVSDDINELNLRIERYNGMSSLDNLKWIEAQQQAITDKYPSNITEKFPDYLKAIYQTLTSEIIREYKQWRSVRVFYHDNNICLPQDILSEIITTMSPKRFTRFLNILYSKKFDADRCMSRLEKLYPIHLKRVSIENVQFHHFLKTHVISLVSDGYARVLKVTHRIHSSSCVIRCRKPSRKESLRVEKHVRQVLQDKIAYFSHHYAERAGLLSSCRLRIIQILPFFHHHNLLNHLLTVQGEKQPVKKCLRLICTSHLQMLDFFMKYQAENFFFTDGKLENFMMHQDVKTGEYRLQIVDFKSTRYLDGNGKYRSNHYFGDWDCSLIYTDGVTPPEIMNGVHSSAEKANVFMLGVNLYVGSTGKRLKYISKRYKIKELTDKNFSKLALFKTEEGIELKKLIMDCVKLNPCERIDYDEIWSRLNRIYPYDLEMTCRHQLNQLYQLDPYHQRVRQMEAELNRAADAIDRHGLNQVLLLSKSMMDDYFKRKKAAFKEYHLKVMPGAFSAYHPEADDAYNVISLFEQFINTLERKSLDLIKSDLKQKCNHLLIKIQKLYLKYDNVIGSIADENLQLFINQYHSDLHEPEVSVIRLLSLEDELASMYRNAKLFSSRMDRVLQKMTQVRQADFLTAIRFLPLDHRMTYRTDASDEIFFQSMITFKTCHDLLKQVNTYRYENINNHPVIVDVPIRRYLHEQIEAIYDENMTFVRLKKIKKKISNDLIQLQKNIASMDIE